METACARCPTVLRRCPELGVRSGQRFFAASKRHVSPLQKFQTDIREVPHMVPHVLSAAVCSAGSRREGSKALWKAYGDRAAALAKRLTCRDVKLMLQGCVAMSHREDAMIRTLSKVLDRVTDGSGRDVCAIAVALAKLNFVDSGTWSWVSKRTSTLCAELDLVDLSTLVSALSRARHPDAPLFDAVSVRCAEVARTDPTTLTPAAVAMVLNGFAVSRHLDVSFWEVMLQHAVVPRIRDFSVTQGALVVNSVARCATRGLDAHGTMSAFAEHWVSTCDLQEDASVKDIVHIADAFARTKVSCENLNLLLVTLALQKLSAFRSDQLALLCGATVHLPSAGRHALFSMVAEHALSTLLQESSLSDLGSLVGVFLASRIPLSAGATDALFATLTQRLKDASVHVPQWKETEAQVISNNAMVSFCTAVVNWPSAERLAVLGALTSLSSLLSDRNLLNPTAVSGILKAHAYLRVKSDAVITLSNSQVDLQDVTPVVFERLVISLSILGTLPRSFGDLRQLHEMAPALSLETCAELLGAVSVLGLQRCSTPGLKSLLCRAKELCSAATPPPRSAAQLMIFCSEWESQGMCHEDVGWIRIATADVAEPSRLDPPPPESVLREAFCVVSSRYSTAAISLDEFSNGFFADIVVRMSGRAYVIEVDGPRRFYHGTHDLIAPCQLKHRALCREFHSVLHVGFWESVEGALGENAAMSLK